jgi:hypothetical protein
VSSQIAAPVRDDEVAHSTAARTHDLVKITLVGEAITREHTTSSLIYQLEIIETGEAAPGFFAEDRSLTDLADEQRRFLKEMGDDFVDLD